MRMKDVIVVSGKYEGRVGVADFTYSEKSGNVMFYPTDDLVPYRVCLRLDQIKEVER